MSETIKNGTPVFTPSAEYLAREKRLNDALAMRQPDRVPVLAPFGYFVPEYGGITHQEYHEDSAKAHAALKKAMLDFQPDAGFGAGVPELEGCNPELLKTWIAPTRKFDVY